jgi:spermidine synthase
MSADVLSEAGVVQFNEPEGSDAAKLIARLLAGAYEKPFVIDDGTVRRLYFNLSYVQSEMTIDQPYRLNFSYTRKMMGFLLFLPQPKHVVIVGLGGGSLTKFCHRHLPRTRLTTIEIDPEVIAFGDLFALPDPDERYTLVQADAAEYFATTKARADVILLDGCDKHGIAADFGNERFYGNLRACLRKGGMLVSNLVGSTEICGLNLKALRQVFAGDVIVQKIVDGGTKVAFAFKDPKFVPDWPGVRRQARHMSLRHELELSDLAVQLQRSVAAAARW